MNPGQTAERVYDGLKERLLSGAIVPGERLEPARFAEDLASSVTPVRDALHRLAGERLVELRTSDGFHLPLVTEADLRDLYGWNAEVVGLAVHSWPRAATAPRADTLAADAPRALAMLLEAAGQRSANGEHVLQIAGCSDRLAAARVAESRVLDGVEAEIRAMALAFDNGTPADFLKLVRACNRRRATAVPAIVRAIYHPAVNNRSISDL